MSQPTTSKPTAGTPNMHGHTVVDPGPDHDYLIVLVPRIEEDEYPHAIVENEVAEARDVALADLTRQEEALDDIRWATRGEFPKVDALYDRLNDLIVATKTTIAKEAVAMLLDVDTVIGGNIDLAVAGAAFSVNAGCKACPCSPGVILGSRLYLGYREVSVWIRPRPAPAQVELTDAQYALLVAAYRGYMFRDGQTLAHLICRDATVTPVDVDDLAALYGHRLIDLADPVPAAGDDWKVELTDAGRREVDARQYAV